METTIPRAVEPADGVFYQRLHDEGVLLDMKSQEYFGLNDVGAAMWELMAEHRDLKAVLKELSARYQASPSALQQDLNRLVSELVARHLLQVVA